MYVATLGLQHISRKVQQSCKLHAMPIQGRVRLPTGKYWLLYIEQYLQIAAQSSLNHKAKAPARAAAAMAAPTPLPTLSAPPVGLIAAPVALPLGVPVAVADTLAGPELLEPLAVCDAALGPCVGIWLDAHSVPSQVKSEAAILSAPAVMATAWPAPGSCVARSAEMGYEWAVVMSPTVSVHCT